MSPALLFGKTDLYLNLETAWAEESVVHHVAPAVCHYSCQSQATGIFAPIGHPDHKNVVELVHPVDLGQQLVDDGVVHLRSKLDNYKR